MISRSIEACCRSLVVLLLASAPISSPSSTTGPTVTPDRTSASPGERVTIVINGFEASAVTVSVCGNQDRRGSSDCNMAASQSVELSTDDTPTVAQIQVVAPPVGCPCLIRVSSRLNDEVAVTPFTVIGHPVEPVTGGPSLDDPLVAVTIDAQPAAHGLIGWAKANLGGSVPYDVTVTVRNITTEALHHVVVFGSAGHSADDTFATLEFDSPGEIGPGQTWTQVLAVEVPAPSIDKVQWQVVASRAGPWVTATSVTRHRPVLLLVFAMVFVVSISLLLIRKRMRRRAEREAAELTTDEDSRRGELVGSAP